MEEDRHEFFEKFRLELKIQLGSEVEIINTKLPAQENIMRQFMNDIGHCQGNKALEIGRKLPGKSQRKFIEKKAQKTIEQNMRERRI